MSRKLFASLVCPGGMPPPKGNRFEDLVASLQEAAARGEDAALVLVVHHDTETGEAAKNAAACALEAVLDAPW